MRLIDADALLEKQYERLRDGEVLLLSLSGVQRLNSF